MSRIVNIRKLAQAKQQQQHEQTKNNKIARKIANIRQLALCTFSYIQTYVYCIIEPLPGCEMQMQLI